MTQLKKDYGTRKKCAGCGKTRAISKFRVLVSGYLAAQCRDCEREKERERWHTRSAASKGTTRRAHAAA